MSIFFKQNHAKDGLNYTITVTKGCLLFQYKIEIEVTMEELTEGCCNFLWLMHRSEWKKIKLTWSVGCVVVNEP